MLKITKDNFDEILENKLVLIDFWADWCMPCKMLTPVIEKLSREYEGRVVFGKINVDEYNEIAAQFGISSIPTLILFKDKEVADRLVGNVAEDKIRKWLNQYV